MMTLLPITARRVRRTVFGVFCTAYVLAIGAAETGNPFAFQGSLNLSSGPASGLYDFEFGLYTDETTGTQVGTTQTLTGVAVTDGLMSVTLDFGSDTFTGAPAWLGIDVRQSGSGGSFNSLAPRTAILPTPLAHHAATADHASTATFAISASFADVADHANTAASAQTANAANSAATATSAETAEDSDALGGVPASNFTPFTWTRTSTGGQLEPNTGFILHGSDNVNITLPPTDSLTLGDTVRINGITTPWTLHQQADQLINVGGLDLFDAPAWTTKTDAGTATWVSVASSSDGSVQLACGNTGVWVSEDSGINWTKKESSWRDIVACSADGSTLLTVYRGSSTVGGRIEKSTNGGSTWSAIYQTLDDPITALAYTPDLSTLIIGTTTDSSQGTIHISTDGGTIFSERLAANSEIEAIDISDDGNTIIACDQTEIWLSTDGGNNFADTDGGYNARDVAMSADGSKIVCVSTRMRMSTDGGATFNEVTSISNQQWRTVTMSADGTKIAGSTRTIGDGDVFTSIDGGTTWEIHNTAGIRRWWDVAYSADGTHLLACATSDYVYGYTGRDATTYGEGGSLAGTAGSTVELQYVGNGYFSPLSYIGELSGQ